MSHECKKNFWNRRDFLLPKTSRGPTLTPQPPGSQGVPVNISLSRRQE
jgi:hypothetical protein